MSNQKNIVIKNEVTHLPSPAEKVRVVQKGNKRIVQWGSNNLLPLDILKISQDSSTLRACLKAKSKLVTSGEFTFTPSTEKKLQDDLNKDYGIDVLLDRVGMDRQTFGVGYIKRMRKGNNVFLYHIDATCVRVNEYKIKPSDVSISYDWSYPYREYAPVQYPLFGNGEVNENGYMVSIIRIADYEAGKSPYPLPLWSGAYYDAQNESLIAQYNLNQFENGITLASILLWDFGETVMMNGQTGSNNDADSSLVEAKNKIERELKGTSNGRSGKTIVAALNGEVKPPEYVKYPIEKEGSFMDLQKMTENKIVTACNWFRSLAGLQSEGSLGNNQQMRNEWEHAERVIKHEQHKIVDAVLEGLGISEDYEVMNTAPISVVNDIISSVDLSFLKPDEIKKLIGI